MTIYSERPTPFCPNNCGNPCAKRGLTKNGFTRWHTLCGSCRKKNTVKLSYRKHKKDHCELCGFIPQIPQQLDVDHIDGNKKNADVFNLQTLCANCHRLKTFQNKDHLKK